MSTTIEIRELADRWQEVLDLAAKGHEIIVVNGVQAAAKLVPIEAPHAKKRVAGLHRGMTQMSDDFDDPVDPETWD